MIDILVQCDQQKCSAAIPIEFSSDSETWGDAKEWLLRKGWRVVDKDVRCPLHSGVKDTEPIWLGREPRR